MNRGIEMHAVEDLIDPDQQQIRRQPVDRRQIVAAADAHVRARLLLATDPRKKIEFTGHETIVSDPAGEPDRGMTLQDRVAPEKTAKCQCFNRFSMIGHASGCIPSTVS
jgi:hypothetical protein